MGRVRYLGSKARIVDHIMATLGNPGDGQRFVDLFCGTGTVSSAAGFLGWRILSNDVLSAATTLSASRMLSVQEVCFSDLGGYASAIAELNSLTGIEGYFFREYSPSGQNEEGVARPYFTIDNAKKIDAIRFRIKEWSSSNLISDIDEKLILADLIEASNQVASIAGTYGCFLKKFGDSSLKTMKLVARPLADAKIEWVTTNLNAVDVHTSKSDVIYIDPPYTKRQYAAYYHVPETIACQDEPKVVGKTGLRPWRTKSSDFCYKSKAELALKALLTECNSDRIILSYSSDGHIKFESLMQIAQDYGQVEVLRFKNFGRYAPNVISRDNGKNLDLIEYLFDIRRTI